MSEKLIECIPNFSEGRNLDTIKKITEAIESIKNIHILDQHSDRDHNRTVITFIGQPNDVEKAAFQAIRVAGELIDLDNHTGSHPRIGATDVVPFVPIAGTSIEDCIDLSRNLAIRVGNELQIPVYLYEESAIIPERKNLENIRKGEYELLKQEILDKPSRKPDFGPIKLTPAGATIIGARFPLIAFNVYLDTENQSIAKIISKSIRESSGGLPSVKALGMLVDGLAQVSMNLTNFNKTSMKKVIEEINHHCEKIGTTIHHSELVGLIPRNAIIESAIEMLYLRDFKDDQILENRLYDISNQKADMGYSFIESLASSNPTPGGGSAAAFSGAMAAALVSMVARLTIGKKKYLDVEAQIQEVLQQSEKLRSKLTTLVQDDAEAFEIVMNSFKLPRGTEEQEQKRLDAIEVATLYAASVPLKVAQASLSVLALAERAVTLGNINAISDAGSAAALAMASIKGAAFNIRINLSNLNSKESGESIRLNLENIEQQSKVLDMRISNTMKQRGII